MSGSGKKGEGSGGWASTFFKVAGAVAATAAVAGTIYDVAKQAKAAAAERESVVGQGRRPQQFPPPAAAPFGVHDDDDDDDDGGGGYLSSPSPFGVHDDDDDDDDGGGGYLSSPSPFGVQQPFHYQEEVILKVDGSLLRKISSAGCGGYLSSASEKWICGFTQKLKFTPTIREDETEREAILRGLLWVKEKGKKKVAAKTDNKGIAILVNSERRCNDPVIRDIRDLVNSDQWDASLSWIGDDDENKVADRLAHKAHSSTSYDLEELDDPPQNCLLLL